MNHLDLFSGIGGFALAAKWAGFTTVGFSEIDPYASAVLTKQFPNIKNYGDIRQITRETLVERIDLITGGFPCQPFSVAGKRKGKADNRDLWPEMLRVIKEFKPTWVLGENVAGFINMELDRTIVDLETEGYEVQPLIIPACAVGAPHRRDRVWIIAHAGRGDSGCQEESKEPSSNPAGCGGKTAADSKHFRFNAAEESGVLAQHCDNHLFASNAHGGRSQEQQLSAERHQQCDQPVADAQGAGLPSGDDRQREEQFWRGYPFDHWRHTNWLEAATRLCRVGNGLPRRMDRIKCLGNAIVPQIAYEILKEITK